ncbi:hypothetical protein TraAM80_01684 [Trypanosoma rangeli]|uniref:SET domain-containing protein n=1 Tax=Trypanosoma rangeli TaxID=5698 RepID=A0A422NY07_TRYRA|nr:uncharacterized protein TraAM80_01684 [Trypanosoma rangeli]RNF10325.1 hypothetical protein TraAM80_01684 [Trypanosoma rangeli]|eukprot:RNF10325.1 hypothetical protein TraAM80_01684 [Trypanosoma rangeli]
MVEVIPTACKDWSLNKDEASGRLFWWNDSYSISIWDNNLTLGQPQQELTDLLVWRAFLEFQLSSVYKVCFVCHQPEGNDDLMLCCFCGITVHDECSTKPTAEQIAWKPANHGFEPYLRVCFKCENTSAPTKIRAKVEPSNSRRVAIRALSIEKEYPNHICQELQRLAEKTKQPHSKAEDAFLIASLRQVLTPFYQSKATCRFLRRERRPEKGNGIGVVAAEDIPAFTIVGLYPGYLDVLSGEHVKLGRPVTKYALMDYNCADYDNVVFEEFQGTFTPFINEPCEFEESNCGWIQEEKHCEGRLSIMTARNIKEGEELLIGYGPSYPRSYPYRYDALTFHKTETEFDTTCFALWRWLSTGENDASLVCYVGYDKSKDAYFMWEAEASR